MNIVEVEDFTLRLNAPGHLRPVLDGVSLALPAGRCLGIVGESGSGKSLLSKALLGDVPDGARSSGHIRISGTELSGNRKAAAAVRSKVAGIVFQDPRSSVNPLHSIGDFLTEAVIRSGLMRRDAARARAIELLHLMRLADPEQLLGRNPDELSGGMLQRVVIAAAMMPKPDLLICDEATTALDVTTQTEIVRLLRELQTRTGVAIIFVTHDLDLAGELCDDLCVLYAGQVQEYGPAADVLAAPRHPYTSALLASIPRITDASARRLPVIPGMVLPLTASADGCRFAKRCAHYAPGACDTPLIPLSGSGSGIRERSVRCVKETA